MDTVPEFDSYPGRTDSRLLRIVVYIPSKITTHVDIRYIGFLVCFVLQYKVQ